MRSAFCLLLFLTAIQIDLSAQPASEKSPVLVTDMLKIKSISGVALNKDGSRAAFTVKVIEADPENKWDYKYVNHLYVVPTDGSAQARELTAKEGASQPAWSPDGKQLAFVRAVEGKPQIFLLSFDGGEPIQFTHFKYGAGTPKWSPDGRKILFSSNISLQDLIKDSVLNPTHSLPKWPDEKPGIAGNMALQSSKTKPNPDGNLDEIRAYLENDVSDRKAKVIDRLSFQDEMGVNPDLEFDYFFIQGLQPGSLPKAITKGYYNYSHAEFTPDNEGLALIAAMDSALNPDRVLETAIYLADANGNNLRLLAGEKNKAYNRTAISPSGKWLAFEYDSTSFVTIPALGILSLHGASKDIVTIPFDRAEESLCWSPDEKYLYFTAESNGGVPLYRVELQSKKIEQLSGFGNGIGSFDIKGNRLVFVKTEPGDPFELYAADPAMQNPVRLTSLNDWTLKKELILPQKHEFKNSLGMTVEYWVMKPAHYVEGKKYPLLLDIHGGPSAMWGPGEPTMWHEFQFFCSRGYGVVYCNPRGSDGYGEAFLRANIKDWGAGPTSDVLTALDRTVAEGWADTAKLLVSGGSYAGYLVGWIIGHDHRFKAACSQRGVYDLATFFGEGNAWRLVPYYFGGYPWEPQIKAILERESPISYVQEMITPYIIFHGENDRRTGLTQGEMLFRSLKALGRPVEYVRHPGATHEITRSGDNRQRIDQMLRTYEFFERWIH